MIKIILVFLYFIGAVSVHADYMQSSITMLKMIKFTKHIPSSSELKTMSKVLDDVDGSKKLGKLLGKNNLSNRSREVIFKELAVHRSVISKKEADELFINLSGTKGFSSTLKKVIGSNSNGTKGHLNELKIANSGHKHGFNVKAIGKRFNDGIKSKDSDIDIILERKGKTFLIESKDYLATTDIKLDKFRGDMDTLLIYARKHPSDHHIPVFSMTHKPQNAVKLNQIKKAAEKRNVQLVFGTPNQQIEQIKLLGDIL